MNISDIKNQAVEQLKTLLKHLPFLTIQTPHLHGHDDVALCLGNSQKVIPIEIHTMRNAGPLIAGQVLLQLQQKRTSSSYPLLAAPYISSETAKLCKQYQIGFLDLSGNCRIQIETIYIERLGNPNKFSQIPSSRSIYHTKTERLLRTLLEAPIEKRSLRQLAQMSRLSLGQTSVAMKQLCSAEMAENPGFKEYQIKDPLKLLQEWTIHYRPDRNHVRRYHTILPPEAVQDAIRTFTSEHADTPRAAWASLSAARLWAPYVQDSRWRVYVDNEICDKFVERLQAKEVAKGENLVVLIPYDEGVFQFAARDDQNGFRTGAIQTYLDVSHEPRRGEEAAHAIFERILQPRFTSHESKS